MKTPGTDLFENAHVRPRPGRTLVVGSRIYREREDRRRRYPDAIGVDMQEGTGVDRVLNLEESPPDDLGTFDHIDCLSVLEHSKRPWLLAANLERLMNPEASLFISVPFVWRIHGYPEDFFRFTPAGVELLFPSIKWTALRFVHWQVEAEGSEKIPTKRAVSETGLTPWFPRTETMGFGVRA